MKFNNALKYVLSQKCKKWLAFINIIYWKEDNGNDKK